MRNFNLYLDYLTVSNNIILFKSSTCTQPIILFCLPTLTYFVITHFKLSSVFFSAQLSDIFSYESPSNTNTLGIAHGAPIFTVFNFAILNWSTRIFIFSATNFKHTCEVHNYADTSSITELFNNASWLEREVAELFGVSFYGKKDLRNLMLPYGDESSPFLKSFPSIGVREVVYDSVEDLIYTSPVSIQF